MLNRFFRVGMIVVFLALAVLSLGNVQKAQAQGSTAVVESIVHEADISSVVNLVQQALIEYRGLSLEDHAVIYNAIGRTNAAIDYLYDTGATGDAFNTAEDLLLTQLDLLRDVEAATLSEDISDLNRVNVRLVDLAQRRLAFERQLGRVFTPAAKRHEVSVIDIARDDAATREAMNLVMQAITQGRPVGLEAVDKVYRALGETARGLDLLDETGETGDVFIAAERLLEYRFVFLTDLEQAVISGDLEDLRAVAQDWVRLAQEQLIFERQVAARDTARSARSFLDRRRSSFLSSTFGRSSHTEVSKTNTRATSLDTPEATAEITETSSEAQAHAEVQPATPQAQIYVVQPGDTLRSIADSFDTTVRQIAQANSIVNPRLISPGQQLTIPNAHQ